MELFCENSLRHFAKKKNLHMRVSMIKKSYFVLNIRYCDLFSCNYRFEIRHLALLPTNCETETVAWNGLVL